MKISEDQTTYIKNTFTALKSKEDLLSLLNYVKALLYGENVKYFELTQLNYHSQGKLNQNRYGTFFIKKKSGQLRTIHSPNKGLKSIQRCLNVILQTVFEPHNSAFGFVPDKSIVDNAKLHVCKNYVYNIDLKDFFPSIDKARLYKRLHFPPFNLDSAEKPKLANIIAGLCCHEMDVERLENDIWIIKKENVLPQGAPTSPTITNIICERLDRRLAGAAKRFNVTYSRYADDITFSSNHNIYGPESEFIKEIERIITDQNFVIKTSKTRLQKQGYRQEVTGIVVNRDTNVVKRYTKELRMWLYYWEHYGPERAYEYFLPRYRADKGHIKKGTPDLANVISGKLEYLKMVRGYDDNLYKKMLLRFKSVLDNNEISTNRRAHLDKVLNIFDKEGLQKAMESFNPKI